MEENGKKYEKNFTKSMKKVTLIDIADEAGVSISCVTRCVNGSGYVSKEKREKVCQVMERMHYIPNQQAKVLRGGSSRLLGHVHAVADENIFFTKMAVTIERKSFEKGYKTITYALDTGDVKMLEGILLDLISYGVDGIIINAGIDKEITEEIGRKAKKLSVPLVMIERPADVYEIEKILVDNGEGSYTAVRKLHNAGHRRIAYLGVVQEEIVEQERYHGYLQAMKGIDEEYAIKNSYFVEEYTVENGYKGCLEILDKRTGEEQPTAIFAASDILAAGVYRALMERKIQIPEDISVVGYDDTIAKFLSPPLSTMQLPVEEIAEAAVNALINKLEEKEQYSGNRTVKIGPVFIERNSIKNIKSPESLK